MYLQIFLMILLTGYIIFNFEQLNFRFYKLVIAI